MVGTAADCLVIYIRRDHAVAWDKAVAVVVSNIDRATGGSEPLKLAAERASGRVIGEQNRVAEYVRRAGSDEWLILPKCAGGRRAVVPRYFHHGRQKSAEIKRGSAIGDIIIRRTIDMMVVVYR